MIKVELLKEGDESEYSEFLKDCGYGMAQHTLEWRNVVREILKDESFYFIARKIARL